MKRVLFVTQGLPTSGSGTTERTRTLYNAVKSVADTEIHEIRLHGPGEDTTWFWRKRKYLLKDFRPDPRIFEEVKRLHERLRFDAFFCRYFVSTLSGCDRLGPTLLDYDDLPEVMPGPKVPGWNRIGWALTHQRLKHFRTVFVTKKSDVARLAHPDVRVLPCASTAAPTLTEALAPPAGSTTMLFVGSLRWPPNRSGVLRFIEQVLPRIRREVPSATLRVVGEDSAQLNGKEGVSGAGFVDDLVAEYRAAALVVCPTFSGSGSNVKLAEAAQFGKAAVATGFAARGFEGYLAPGRDMAVADTDEEFAAACVRLLTNDGARRQMEQQALRTAQELLSQPAIDRTVRSALEACW